MTELSPTLLTLITFATLALTGALLWWARQYDVERALEDDMEPGSGLYTLFDELSRAAEDDGVYDDDAPLNLDLEDLNPAPVRAAA